MKNFRSAIATRFILATLSLYLVGNPSGAEGLQPAADLKVFPMVECKLDLDGEPQTLKVLQIKANPIEVEPQRQTMLAVYGSYRATAEVSALLDAATNAVKISADVSFAHDSQEIQESGSVRVSGQTTLQVSMGSIHLICETLK